MMNRPEPGLELDKLIAEKILDWYQDSDIDGPRACWFEKGNEGDIRENALHLNRFSIDIKAAWDLVEMFQLCVVPWKSGWSAFQQGCAISDGPRNAAPTAPRAICLAALFYAEKE
jgi:hypothetical protein